MTDALNTHSKALQVNLDPLKYGTFAEIGAGQEVARWFFRVGGAAGTIAKAMSAYDMTFSDAIYGHSDRYVSRQRLRTMLDHEYGLLIERLDTRRGNRTRFFVFADTVATRSYSRKEDGHGWLGIRYQTAPMSPPSDITIHVRLIDAETDQHIWADTYDRQLTDIFAIQSDVALHIANALQAELSLDERTRLNREPTNDLEAYQLYLQGRHWLVTYTESGILRAITYFEQATTVDPRFAMAFVGIAQACAEIGMGQGGIRHLPSPHEARAMVLAASIARLASVLSSLRSWWDVLIARTSPHLVIPSAPFGTVVEVS